MMRILKKLTVNTLVMTGEYDVGSTIDMSQELSKVIKNSELKIVKRWKTSLWY